MRDFQDTFETCKRSFVIAFSFCRTVPLREIRNSFKKRPLDFCYSSSKTIMEIANVIKVAILKYSILKAQKQLLSLWPYYLFLWQTLTDDFR